MFLFLLASWCGCASTAQRHYDFYARLNDWDKAVRALERDLAAGPDDPEILCRLGEAYGYKGEYEKMDEMFNRSISITKHYSDDIEHFRDLLVARQLNTGISLFDEQHYREAANAFERVGQIREGETRQTPYLGLCYSAMGQYEVAVRYLRLAVERDHDIDSRLQLARVYHLMGNDRGVIEVSEGLLEARPERRQLLEIAAVAYEREKDYAHAISTYEKLLDVSPGDPAACYNLALLLCRSGKVEDAIPLLRRLSDQEPGEQGLRYKLCSLLYDTGRDVECLSCFQEYLARSPGDAQAIRYLIAVNTRLKRWEDVKSARRRLQALSSGQGDRNHDLDGP